MAARAWLMSHTWSSRTFRASVLFCALPLLSPQAALAQFSQDGSKLVGTHAANPAAQGFSVAVSADGSTAIVGGIEDDVANANGAAWVFTRGSNGVWTQQGGALAATGIAYENAQQGRSVALSADGNTAIVGGPQDGCVKVNSHNDCIDNSQVGAAWIYFRSGGTWSHQGSKIVGTGAVGASFQGYSVALSADGNTAIVGGPDDGNYLNQNIRYGAAWVFTRSGAVWTQQGGKLVGSGVVNGNEGASQGFSAALSADGNTAIVGGPGDTASAGAAWVFTHSGGKWTQQGAKLVGTGAVGKAQQGYRVALSADGNTAIVGGPYDNSGAGGVWIFSRSDGIWKQQGAKLTGTGAVGQAGQGFSVAMSALGNTAIVGGPGDKALTGATWVFARSGTNWTQQGAKIVGAGSVGEAAQSFSVALSGDGAVAIVGGLGDNSGAGAAWVFVQPLQVAPYAGVAASGKQGGPFSPSSFGYTLSATSGSVKYSIAGVPSWLTASSTSGTLTTAGKTVTFKINASADKLAPGVYVSAIEFDDADGKQKSISRAVTLTVKAK